VGIIVEQSKNSSVIRLEGTIDIAAAAEFKKSLLQSLGSGNEIRIALDGATDMDVTAVQLIWAARRAAEGTGLAFSLSFAVPASVSSALGKAGLQQFLAPVDAK
jgi:anti-anti-sigma factor